jgi:hypothetical protein
MTQQEKNRIEAAAQLQYNAQPQQPVIEVIDTVLSKKGIVSNTNKVSDTTDASKVSDNTDASKVSDNTDASKVSDNTDASKVSDTTNNNKVANIPAKQPAKNKFLTPTVIGIGLVIIGAIAYLKMKK